MSLKAKIKRERQTNKKSPSDILIGQKKRIKSSVLDCLGSSLFFIVLEIILLLLRKFIDDTVYVQRIFSVVAGCLFICALCFAISCLRRFFILKEINEINNVSEETVTIVCQKVSFFTESWGYTRYRSNLSIVCMIFTNEDGNKYYYIFMPNRGYYDNTKSVKKLVGSQVLMTCYSGTNFVQHYRVIIDQKKESAC